MSKETFELMRLNILKAALSSETAAQFTDSFVFAWQKGVYPLLHFSRLAKPFADDFDINADMMSELTKELNAYANADDTITFYELERYFFEQKETKWSRGLLVDALRYLFLFSDERGGYSNDFFNGLIVDGGGPSEASIFNSSFIRKDDVTFD